MKKTILSIAILSFLSIGSGFAQRTAKVIISYPAASSRQPVIHQQEVYSLQSLDHIVNLSRQQESQIRKIENKYYTLQNSRHGATGKFESLENQKQREMIAVLSPKQYDRLQAFEKDQRNNRVAYRR